MSWEHEIEVRVRYHETDGQGIVHHANYLHYFELARTEMLRVRGQDYEVLEQQGHLLVVIEMSCRYHAPARFGDLLNVRATTAEVTKARIRHVYRVTCGEKLVATGQSMIACVDRNGRIRRIPLDLSTD